MATSSGNREGVVTPRHLVGALLGAFAAWLVVLAFLSLYAAILGFGALAPFEGPHSTLDVQGGPGLPLGLVIDFVIPAVAALIFVGALLVLSRTTLRKPSFLSTLDALVAGTLLGVCVWALLFVPFTIHNSGPLNAQVAATLGMGLLDHLAFGAVVGLVIFRVGGPVRFAGHRTQIAKPPPTS